jgi:hypothetical protein
MGCKFIGRFLPIFSLSRLWLFVLVEGTERTKQLRNRVARIFLGSTYQNEKNIPNGRKICHKIYQHFPLYSTPKYNRIRIFDMQIYHLATLPRKQEQKGVQ